MREERTSETRQAMQDRHLDDKGEKVAASEEVESAWNEREEAERTHSTMVLKNYELESGG